MCKYGSCREQWEHSDSGQGKREYCKSHSKVRRLDTQRNYDKTKRLNRTIKKIIL